MPEISQILRMAAETQRQWHDGNSLNEPIPLDLWVHAVDIAYEFGQRFGHRHVCNYAPADGVYLNWYLRGMQVNLEIRLGGGYCASVAKPLPNAPEPPWLRWEHLDSGYDSTLEYVWEWLETHLNHKEAK